MYQLQTTRPVLTCEWPYERCQRAATIVDIKRDDAGAIFPRCNDHRAIGNPDGLLTLLAVPIERAADVQRLLFAEKVMESQVAGGDPGGVQADGTQSVVTGLTSRSARCTMIVHRKERL